MGYRSLKLPDLSTALIIISVFHFSEFFWMEGLSSINFHDPILLHLYLAAVSALTGHLISKRLDSGSHRLLASITFSFLIVFLSSTGLILVSEDAGSGGGLALEYTTCDCRGLKFKKTSPMMLDVGSSYYCLGDAYSCETYRRGGPRS